MLFVQTEKLEVGMRIARPIYNRTGTLLYERNSKLSIQGISSIKNFGLIGIYILEPAEPVPPMTKDDIEFERFQTMSVFSLKDELDALINRQETTKLNSLANSIIKSYGRIYHKINFSQNLRSIDDYVYKHSLNVAILSALISHQLGFTFEEQLDVVIAALLHDINKLLLPHTLVEKDYKTFRPSDEHTAVIHKSFTDAMNLIQYDPNVSSNTKTMITQHHAEELGLVENTELDMASMVPMRGTMVLKVAEIYDSMTAMKSYCEPTSEVTAIRYLLANTEKLGEEIVIALTNSIHILPPGVCVTLTNSDNGIVITENHTNVLQPVVLSFNYNKVYNLGIKSVYYKLQILDVMKTLDNRFVMDKELFDEYNREGKLSSIPKMADVAVADDNL